MPCYVAKWNDFFFFFFLSEKSFRAKNEVWFSKVVTRTNKCPCAKSNNGMSKKNKWKKIESTAGTVGQIFSRQDENPDFRTSPLSTFHYITCKITK